MKKNLLTLMVLLLITSCSNDNEKQEDSDIVINALIYIPEFSISYDNQYAFIGDNEFIGVVHGKKENQGYSYTNQDIVWEKKRPELEDEKEEIGYGEFAYFPYSLKLGQFILKTYNIVVIFEARTSGSNFKHLFFYDEKGNILNESKIKSEDIRLTDCPWDENKMAIEGYQCILHVFDRYGNEEIVHYIGKENFHPLFMSWKNIKDNNFFIYSTETIHLISFKDNEIKEKSSVDLNLYIKNLYPNEGYTPKINNIELSVSPNNSIASIEIVFYSGEKNVIQLILDNQTGEIIE